MLLATTIGAGSIDAANVPFSSARDFAEGGVADEGIHAADIDGDGDLDVVGGGDYGPSALQTDIAWWENVDGWAEVWQPHAVAANLDHCLEDTLGYDMDGDGDCDIVAAVGDPESRISWWENVDGVGSDFREHLVASSTNVNWHAIAIGHIDGDDDLDVLAAALWPDSLVAWFENDGTSATNWSRHPVVEGFSGASAVVLTDIDGDGTNDLIASAYSAGIRWWRNVDGSGTNLVEYAIDADLRGSYGLDAADIDGDGDMDVISPSASADNITWYENTATPGNWPAHVVATNFNAAQSVHAADLDGDGDVDLLGGADFDEDVAWWENTDGQGGAWTKHLIDGDFVTPHDVWAADLDRDGDIDVMASVATWWENLAIDFVAEGDDDGDGMLNWWENIYFGGPTNAVGDGNQDGDPQCNVNEWIAGTDPTNAASYFRIKSVARDSTGGSTVLSWDSVAGRLYSVRRAPDLTTNFVAVASNLLATPPENTYTGAVHDVGNTGFYVIDVKLGD